MKKPPVKGLGREGRERLFVITPEPPSK